MNKSTTETPTWEDGDKTVRARLLHAEIVLTLREDGGFGWRTIPSGGLSLKASGEASSRGEAEAAAMRDYRERVIPAARQAGFDCFIRTAADVAYAGVPKIVSEAISRNTIAILCRDLSRTIKTNGSISRDGIADMLKDLGEAALRTELRE